MHPILIFLLVAATAVPLAAQAPEPTAPAPVAPLRPESVAPRDSRILDEVRARGRTSALGDLAEKDAGAGDVELRYWGGFGVTGTAGIVLRREAGIWRGWRVQVDKRTDTLVLDELKSRLMPAAWEAVLEVGAPILPTGIERTWRNDDGYTHVIELRVGKSYRASVIQCAPRPENADDYRVQKVAGVLARLFPTVAIGCTR